MLKQELKEKHGMPDEDIENTVNYFNQIRSDDKIGNFSDLEAILNSNADSKS